MRVLPIVAVTVAAALGAPPQSGASGAVADRAVIDRYCTGCHNSKSKIGGLDLASIGTERIDRHSEVWEKVVRKLTARSMPPVGLPRPDERTYQSLVAGLVKSLDANAAAKPDPGRTDTFRRLNRTEYQNSVRDLLATDVDVSALLPDDESAHGFDNVTVGELSPTLLERYLSAARKISRLAVGIPARSPGGDVVMAPPDLTQETHVEEAPFGTRGGKFFRYTFPMNAEYEIQIRLTRDRDEHVEGLSRKQDVDLLLDGRRLSLFTVKPPSEGQDHSQIDSGLHIRVPVTAGPHVVGVTFPGEAAVLPETERQPYKAAFNANRHPRPHPAVYTVTINGPFSVQSAGDTPGRRRIFTCHPARTAEEEGCARKILLTLMRRAYRRPATEADLAIPMKFYRDARRDSGFESGIEMALRSILMSAEFLFRVEQPPSNAQHSVYQVSDLALASRLSFFLWSSIPDDELLETAIQGKLKQPAVMEQQTRRMLADPRSRNMITNFVDQWLYLRNLDSVKPDLRLFADFDDNLRQSFKEETEVFAESIMREDRSILEFLGANYTFLNERLAKHYGIRHVYGSRFRRVTFSEDAQRGGLLRQGSLLAVTSYATRTSPVIRGKWILSNILGAPPPPPPPLVPALKENHDSLKVLPMRQRLAEHRANPACAGCHSLMDPVGFSLENYDAVGRWRDTEAGEAVDISGGLPDGSKFDGVLGLEKALLSRPELFATTFTEKLLTFALGRGVEYYDAPAVRRVVADAHAKDFRFSSFVLGIVKSTPFQMRRSQ